MFNITLAPGLASDVSIMEFQAQVATACGVDPAFQQFKAGFPPQKLELQGRTVADLGLAHGETLILQRHQGSSVAKQAQSKLPNINGSNSDAGLGAASVAGTLPDGRWDSAGLHVSR